MSDQFFLSRILPSVFFLIGIGLLIGAILYIRRTKAFLARAKETTGEVVALEEVPPTASGESSTYRPIVSFQISDTRRIKFKTLAHSNPPQYKIGTPVRVLYIPANPHDARIYSFTSLWLLAVILSFLGAVFTFLGVCIFLGFIPT
ncbi:MAG: DUF3592 domain-containing protein [Desulfatitalea sp.]